MSAPSFYHRYKLFLGSNPALGAYLRWVYDKTDEDFTRWGREPPFGRVLLCGTSGEVTSTLFARHVFQHDPSARLTILDAGETQIRKSEQSLSRELPDADVHYVVANATRSGLPDGSVDRIDTDFLFVYLTRETLDALFAEWRRVLAPGGALSFRALLTRSVASRAGSKLMNLWCDVAFGAPGHSHTMDELKEQLSAHGFDYRIAGRAFLPMGYRVVARKK